MARPTGSLDVDHVVMAVVGNAPVTVMVVR